jgi:hypothetical protein
LIVAILCERAELGNKDMVSANWEVATRFSVHQSPKEGPACLPIPSSR